MKSLTIATTLLGITSLSSAAVISKRQNQNSCILQTVMNPGTDAVEASINQWNSDVVNVNNFLNQAPALITANDPATLVSAAMDALTNANDEPCQLMTLASQSDFSTGPDAFTCAVEDLTNVFQIHVLDNLMLIIGDPTDTETVTNAVEDINNFRCCNVLGDASILWQDSAEDNGIGNEVNVVAPFPNACSAITCTNQCSTEDNGGFGTPGDTQSPGR